MFPDLPSRKNISALIQNKNLPKFWQLSSILIWKIPGIYLQANDSEDLFRSAINFKKASHRGRNSTPPKSVFNPTGLFPQRKYPKLKGG